MKTSELTGDALDWAVWSIEFKDANKGDDDLLLAALNPKYSPSTDWSLAGPIIEQEQIDLMHIRRYKSWSARGTQRGREAPPIVYRGETALIAAMRCYVATKLGDEVDIPQELTK